MSRAGMHVLIIGNPVDGIAFFGPYTTGEEAAEAGLSIASGDEWWIAPIKELTA